jgi:putative drug exporter of the RND superfamily
MSELFGSLGRGVVRLRWVIVVAWVVGTVAAVHELPSISSQVDDDNRAFLPASAPINQAAALAKPLAGSTQLAQVPLVAVTEGRALDASDEAYLTRLSRRLTQTPSVTQVLFIGISPDRRAVEILARSSRSYLDQSGDQQLIDGLRSRAASTPAPPGMQVHLSGQLATNVANQKASARTQSLTQTLTILFILVLLLVIFRAVLAPILTLLPALLALLLSEALIGGLGSAGLKISSVTPLLLIVLVLGAGTDYGLFLVFRVREELQTGDHPRQAVSRALAKVGESIAASGATVVVALLSLAFTDFGVYRDLGPPLALGIGIMLLAGITLVPALLAIFGRAVFWPALAPAAASGPRVGWWGRVAARLVRRPGVSLAVGVGALGLLALATLGFAPGGFSTGLAAPPGSDAAAGNAAVTAHFPQTTQNPTNLLFRYPTSVWSDPYEIERAQRVLASAPPFSELAGPFDANGGSLSPAQLVALHAQLGPARDLPELPPPGLGISVSEYDTYRATALFVSADGHTVQFEAGLRAGDPGSTAALDAVPSMRRAVASAARASGANASGVAGEAPALYDVSTTSDGDLGKIIPIAVLAIGLVLALVLRSLVAPIYLLLSVVLSYLASLGLAVVLFIFLGGQGGITFLLPFLMFVFLLALGEDYNILVMTRIREEAQRGPLRRAVVRAVGATGPTVTSAGLVLAGSFLVLALTASTSPGNGEVTAIGVGLAVGILLDTFVVRTVLVPCTVQLLGRWNWWPGRMGRRGGRSSNFPPLAATLEPAPELEPTRALDSRVEAAP